jgi:hypothetical protein
VEWGDGIYGAEAAARAYFRKPAAALSAPEAALLAGALVNARVLVPTRPNERLARRQRIILARMGSVTPPPPVVPAHVPVTLDTPNEPPAPELPLTEPPIMPAPEPAPPPDTPPR